MSLDDENMPDMATLHEHNDLVPDPSKLRIREIPAEDIAGWFLPFEIVFGIAYWNTYGIYLFMAFLATIIGGWFIPMQQRYAILAKANYMKERTQLGHLGWEEQSEIIKFEPILEPEYKKDEDGKIMRDEEDDLIPDDLDIEDWVTELDVDSKIIEHPDGFVLQTHRLDTKYLTNLLVRLGLRQEENFQDDMVGYTVRGMQSFFVYLKDAFIKSIPYWKLFFISLFDGVKTFGRWMIAHKKRLIGAIIAGFLIILFSPIIQYYLIMFLKLIGWQL